jgi:ectoine hydroxylase-related dioxygenase (phytanoyl-CoA dioxygenase family)
MKVNPQQLRDDGYIILREVIPPEQLDDVRASFEVLVERQKEIWAQQSNPSVWETGAQPRLAHFESLIDEETANAVETWMHENTLGVARQLLSVPEQTGIAGMMLMCSPQRDHGPAHWHRDVHPIDMAPMASLQADFLENGPKYLQWNVSLYDDDVLWVVPGSHRRLNTEEENCQLLKNPRVPLPGGIPVELKGGDGVVYSNYILHWGSNYSTKLRRTIHGGHTIFPYYPDLNFAQFLSPAARQIFEDWTRESNRMQDLTESALRAILKKDAEAYCEVVEALQPGAGEKGKMVLAIYLSKAAYHIHILKSPDLDKLPPEVRRRASSPHSISINWGPQFADRFSKEEADPLWQRFEVLDTKLQAEEELFVPGFQSGPMRYFFEEEPSNFEVEDFIASW